MSGPMDQSFVRVVELVFTAYAVPALLVPAVWLARRVGRAFSPERSRAARGRARVSTLYGARALGWVAVWAAAGLGVPIERAGRMGTAACWAGYGAANLALAWLLVRFTADYGSLPDGGEKDRLFLRLLGAVAAQPITTAVALSVLARVAGVAARLNVAGLAAVREGLAWT